MKAIIGKTTDNTLSIKNIVRKSVRDYEFNQWYKYMRRWEGGYVNHPNDPGGETNKGITLRTFKSLANMFGYSPKDYELFRRMPEELHKKISREAFWNPVAKLIKEDCITIFIVDYIWGSGSSGVKRVQRFLNKEFGANIEVDGIFGQSTATALNKAIKKIGSKALFRELMAIRRKHLLVDLMKNPKLRVFYRGWKNRLDDVEKVIKQCIKKKDYKE